MNYYGSAVALTQPGGWVNISDRREKSNIKPLKTDRSLERILACKTVTYNRIYYKDDGGNDLVPDSIKQQPHIGLIAQEQLETNPHCVASFETEKNEQRYGIQYNDYVIHLIGAVQQQQATIAQQATNIQTLTAHVTTLTNTLNALLAKYPI
jgi:hypothetical protein